MALSSALDLERRCIMAEVEVEEEADAEVAGRQPTEEGGDIIAVMTTTMDTNAATIVARTTPKGGGGGGGRGGGVVGRAIEGMCRLWPSSWPSPLLTSAVVNVGHRHGHRLVGHRRDHLHRRHRPCRQCRPLLRPSTSGTCGGGLMAKRGGTNLITSLIFFIKKSTSINFWSIIN